MQQVIGFLKGMRRGLTPLLHDSNSYHKAVNKSVITDSTDSSGAISDEIGNLLIRDLLDDIVPVGQPTTILKLDSVRDWVVGFVKLTPEAGDLIIRFKYDESINEISDYTAIYAGILNLSYNIETVYRYRDTDFCKVYWADGINQLRSINIFDPNSTSLPIGLLDATPEFSGTQPKITDVINGGMYKTGKIQYSYQLYNLNGSETVFAPLSIIVPLSTESLNKTTETFKGSDKDLDTGKSVQVLIENIDSNFEFIKVVALHYVDEISPPSITVVEERRVPDNYSISLIDGGSTILDVYTPEEFAFLGSRIIIPKSIDTKDNYLIAANIKEEYFDIDEALGEYWDARTYRFSGNSPLSLVVDARESSQTDNLNGASTGNFAQDYQLEFTNVVADTDPASTSGTPINLFTAQESGNYRFRLSVEELLCSFKDSAGGLPKISYDAEPDVALIRYSIYDGTTHYAESKLVEINVLDNSASWDSIVINTGVISLTAGDTMKLYLRVEGEASITAPATSEFSFITTALKFEVQFADTVTGFSKVKMSGQSYEDVDMSFEIDGDSIPIEHDCIVDKYDQYSVPPNIGNESLCQNLDSNLGGEGVNIKYEFIVQPIKIDNSVTVGVDEEGAASFDEITKVTVGNSNQVWPAVLDTSYVSNLGYSNYASPINAGQLVGYKRDEIYRFGIVFLDAYGRHSFVKWISDIKMPAATEEDSKVTYTINGTDYYDYKTFYYDPSTKCTYANVLGIKFTVGNVPEGYKWFIVRAERTEDDKTILAQGIFNYVHKDTHNSEDRHGSGIERNPLGHYLHTDVTVNKELIIFNSPEISYGTSEIKTISSIDTVKPLFPVNGQRISLYDYQPLIQDINHKGRIVKLNTWGDDVDGNDYTSYIFSQQFVTDSIKLTPYDKATIANFGSSFPFHNRVNYDGFDGSNGNKQAIGIGSTCQLLSLNSQINLAIGIVNRAKNDGKSNWHLILDYERNSDSIYGGNTYNAKLASTYIKVGNLREDTDDTSYVFGGDTYIGFFDFQQFTSDWNTDNDYDDEKYSYTKYVPLESSINLDYVNGFLKSKDDAARKEKNLQETTSKGFEYYPSLYSRSYLDYFKYNPVYSRDGNVKVYSGKPYNFTPLVNLDTRIIDSERLVVHDDLDYWLKFLYTSLIDLDGQHGAVNKIKVFNSRLFSFQDKAVAYIGYNDRELQQSNSVVGLILGTGNRLSYSQYISQSSGAIHTKSIIDTGSGLYYFDGINRRLCLVTSEGIRSISDELEMSSFFKLLGYNGADKINNILDPDINKGIVSGYDTNLRKLFVSFFVGTEDDPITISFNERLQSFESEHTWASPIYLNHQNNLITTSGTELYVQNKGFPLVFFGSPVNSSVTFLVNGNPTNKKVFTNFEFGSYIKDNSDLFNYPDYVGYIIQIYQNYVAYVASQEGTLVSPALTLQAFQTLLAGDEYVNTDNNFYSVEIRTPYQYKIDYITDRTNLKRKFRTWRYQIPRDKDKLRFMDYFCYITLTNKPQSVEIDDEIIYSNKINYIDSITAYYLIPML